MDRPQLDRTIIFLFHPFLASQSIIYVRTLIPHTVESSLHVYYPFQKPVKHQAALTNMRQARLNVAALALGRILNPHGVQLGIFGGGAIAMLVGPRVSKELDVIAVEIWKDVLVQLVNNKGGFRYLNDSRNDVAIFIWNDRNNSGGVTGEWFTGESHDR